MSLAIYVMTLAPGLTWAHDSVDGGDLATAVALLGVPHPPGYPTYVLLAYPFALLPVGEIATGTNLFSAVCAALAAAILAGSLARMLRSRAAAIGAGLSLAFTRLVWSQAVVTEVHTLNCLFATTILALFIGVSRAQPGSSPAGLTASIQALGVETRVPFTGRQAGAFVLGCVWGLGLGNHLTLVFLAPVVILVLHRSRQPVRWTVLGLILGLSVYVLLPLRAASGLPVGWGDARTPSGLWWIISGGPYRRFAFALPVAQLPARLVSWARITVEQFGIPGAIVAGLGLLGLRGTDRRFFWGTVGAVALCAVFALGYDTTDSHLYLIPALVCAATWLGVGADWLIDGAQKLKPRMGWLLAAGAVAMPLIGAVMRWPAQDLSRERSAAAFAEATLWAAPQRAVLLSREDGHTFALWYYHYALGHRPDVAIVDVDLLSHTWYVEQLQPRLDVTEIQKVRQGSPDALTTAAAHLSRSICLVYGEYLQCVAP